MPGTVTTAQRPTRKRSVVPWVAERKCLCRSGSAPRSHRLPERLLPREDYLPTSPCVLDVIAINRGIRGLVNRNNASNNRPPVDLMWPRRRVRDEASGRVCGELVTFARYDRLDRWQSPPGAAGRVRVRSSPGWAAADRSGRRGRPALDGRAAREASERSGVAWRTSWMGCPKRGRAGMSPSPPNRERPPDSRPDSLVRSPDGRPGRPPGRPSRLDMPLGRPSGSLGNLARPPKRKLGRAGRPSRAPGKPSKLGRAPGRSGSLSRPGGWSGVGRAAPAAGVHFVCA